MATLTKTLITQLTNSYIDCSYTKSVNTIVVNIETPSPTGDDIRQPFTIRTKDGFSLKYDENAGKVVFRVLKQLIDYTLPESDVIADYDTYFTDFTLDLKTLATYKNNDPVIEFKTPTFKVSTDGIHSQTLPRFEYSDIEQQKENIYIIPTGLKEKGRDDVFIASYYGKDPNRCKLELLTEVFVNNGTIPTYVIKTQSGRYFKIKGGTILIDSGKSVSQIVSIGVNAEKTGEVIEEDTTDGLFSTYVVSQNDLKKITESGKINNEIIINTFSYPVKFIETDLLKTNIVLGNTPIEGLTGLRFKRAEPKIKIFSFNVPYLKDVESCKLLLPFNPEITLDYDIIRGKVMSGYVQYEVSTNSSTLYIDNEDVEFYKDTIVIETVVPFKPTGEYANFKESEKRLGKQVPTLLIKCLQEEKQQLFIQGKIEYPIKGILKDELNLLNNELEKGVITNE